MAVSITWGTKVIYVPKADLSLIQASPEVREIDLDWFRLALRDLEDDPEGMPFPDTHRHVTETTLAGLTYARIVEIINGYTVEFEDGQYTVNCVGANHNLSDVKVANQVSLIVNNAAGLITNAAIEYSSFNGGVTVDLTSVYSGTVYPRGTPRMPVNNLDDALMIAGTRGFTKLYIIGNATLSGSVDLSNFEIVGQSANKTVLTIDPAPNTSGCEFKNATVTGTLDGENFISDCDIVDLTYVNGSLINCGLIGDIVLAGGANAVINDCYTIDQDDPPVINMGGLGQSLAMPNYSGLVEIKNLTDPSQEVGIGLNHGHAVIENTVSAGTIIIAGIGSVTDNSIGAAVVDSSALISNESISDAVWGYEGP